MDAVVGAARLPRNYFVATADARRIGGQIVFLLWTTGLIVQVAYMVAFDEFSLLAWTVAGSCLSMAVVSAAVRWERMSENCLYAMVIPGVATCVIAAFDLRQPASVTFLFPIAVLMTTVLWRQWAVMLPTVTLVFAIFVGVSLAVGGPQEPARVLIATPLMVATSLLVGYLGERFATMALQRRRFKGTITSLLFALQARDGYTADHSAETLDLVMGVADYLDLDESERNHLSDVALLHDIGKIGIPNEILHKPGGLTDEEWEIMREHPVIGQRILLEVPGFERTAIAVRHEHERWDGAGYPDGISGHEIPLASRVVLACDAYHAMTTDRPYRVAMTDDEARAELLRNAGTQFDPAVVAGLLATLDRHARGAAANHDHGAESGGGPRFDVRRRAAIS